MLEEVNITTGTIKVYISCKQFPIEPFATIIVIISRHVPICNQREQIVRQQWRDLPDLDNRLKIEGYLRRVWHGVSSDAENLTPQYYTFSK